MNKKAIVFLRVSTAKQTLEQQQEIMMGIARREYKDDEIVIVKGKESATKLVTIDERQTLTALYDTINANPTIERIFFFAVDRLARKATLVNETVKDLASRHIDCYFHYPYQMHSLSVADGSMNLMTDMMLYFLGVGAEMEGALRAERVNAKREIMRQNQQLFVGKPLFGYTLDEDKHIVPDEKDSEIVRYIFREYIGGKSYKQISDELIRRGVFENASYSTNIERVRSVVSNNAYSGGKPKKGNNVYPPIVTPSVQKQAQDKAKENFVGAKKESKTLYFGKQLVRSAYSGRAMIPVYNSCTYRTNVDDEVKMVFNSNVMDSLIWIETKFWYTYMLAKKGEQDKELYERELDENKAKIEHIKQVLDDLDKQHSRLYKQYVKGNIKESDFEESVDDIRKQTEKWNKNIVEIESRNTTLKGLIENGINEGNFVDYIPNDASDETKYEIVHKVWSKFTVEKTTDGHFKVLCYLNGFDNPLDEWFEYWHSGKKKWLVKYSPLTGVEDMTNQIVHRFDRKRKKGF